MGSWFGKGGGDSAPPPMPTQQPQDNSGEIMAAMMGMMEMMNASSMSMMHQAQAQPPQLPPMPQVPEIARQPVVDWTDKQEQLAAKAKADYNVEQARRKGRSETILTSPLLDEDDATVTGSVLAGE